LSADTNVRKLGFLLERLGVDAESVVRIAREDPDKLRDRLVRYAGEQKRAGRLDTYVLKSFDGLRSYLEHRHVRFDGYPKLAPVKGQSLANERVPTPEELGRVLERLSLRGRVIALLMAHSGLRPGVLGSYGGERGLRLGDLPELKLSASPRFAVTPFVVRVPGVLSKTRAAYTTFGTQQLVSALVAYLEARQMRGEKLTVTSPLVAAAETRGIARRSRETAHFGKGFLTTKAVVEEIREALRAVLPEGVTWRPYVLRSYCSTRLLIAESHGRISRDLREAILGHDGGVASRYNVGKAWGPELLAEARRAYDRASEFLLTEQRSTETRSTEAFVGLLLKRLGMDEDTDLSKLSEREREELADRMTRRHRAASPEKGSDGTHDSRAEPNRREAVSTPPAEAVVSILDVGSRLAAGWEFVSPLGVDQAVVRWTRDTPAMSPLSDQAPRS